VNLLHFDASRLLLAAGILAATFLVRLFFHKVILKLLIRVTALTSMRHDDLVLKAIQPPATVFLASLGVYLALGVLNLPATPVDLPRWVDKGWHLVLAVLAVWLLYRLVEPLCVFLEDRLFSRDETARRQFSPILTGVLRFLMVSLSALFIAHNMGYQVTSLLAGLGIGGLAVALAAQDTLANILGTVVVLSDQPFRIGDWVRVDGQEGTVESIGFRSTRIRTFARSVIVVPNKLLTERQIENWSAMNMRRVKATLGLLYSTPPARIELFVARLREMLEGDPEVEPGQSTVSFTDFGASSLDVLVVYFTRAVPYNEHLEVRQRLNLRILALAEELGLSFAFPTRTVVLESAGKGE
jgi:MscS family membrane protein